jgi:hypothetical protein
MRGLGASGAAMVRLEQPLAPPWRRSSIWPRDMAVEWLRRAFWGASNHAYRVGCAWLYGLKVLGPDVRRQEVDKRCLENINLF